MPNFKYHIIVKTYQEERRVTRKLPEEKEIITDPLYRWFYLGEHEFESSVAHDQDINLRFRYKALDPETYDVGIREINMSGSIIFVRTFGSDSLVQALFLCHDKKIEKVAQDPRNLGEITNGHYHSAKFFPNDNYPPEGTLTRKDMEKLREDGWRVI